MSAKETHTAAISLPPVPMNEDPIRVSVTGNTLEMDLNASLKFSNPVLRSENTSAVQLELTSLTQMVRDVWHHLQCTATWLARMELA